MMDKKSANGFSSKAGEEGVQRKQLPYSVETPYGFHLDLDFLKYVDDIEKGNTIKRVHIHRRVRGPKFSTLPRNFSLPGHGARPAPKEKDSAWSGTSTLGPKPKSRVTEVQQIFDFRPSDVGTAPSQTSRGTTSQSSISSMAKPREEAGAGAQVLEEKPFELQGRPNLLRASSMPVTVQHRKGSDSSSPDRTVITPENGSSENVFRASADVTERRCLPQDRGGLHQQITVALKRVRELEEQVKTIPELKAQICSLREEREQLLLQLQAQAKLQAQASASSSTTALHTDPGAHTPPQRAEDPSEPGSFSVQKTIEADRNLSEEQPTGDKKQEVLDRPLQTEREMQQGSFTSSVPKGEAGELSVQKPETQAQLAEDSDSQREALESQREHGTESEITVQEITSQPAEHKVDDVVSDMNAVKVESLEPYTGSGEDLASVQQLHVKLTTLEAKLTQASQELESTNALLREQVAENKQKEQKILQLSEEVRVEVCTVERKVRRESVDRGTETEKVVIANQETETEVASTVDQGTDTEKICIEIIVPRERAGSIDQGTETERVDTQDQVTETVAENTVDVCPFRPRTNSVDRGTETERINTQDQVTETPVAGRVDQVTETELEAATDHPVRPRTRSVDRGTETDRVGTVDRVTETESAERSDQQTETETERQEDNSPRVVDVDNQSEEGAISEGVETDVVVTERVDVESRASDEMNSENVQSETVVTEATITESSIKDAVEKDSLVSDSVLKTESKPCENIVAESSGTETESTIKDNALDVVTAEKETVAMTESEASEGPAAEGTVHESIETEKVVLEQVAEHQTVKVETEIMSITTKETVSESVTESVVVVVSESSTVKTGAPVRPQRGRKHLPEQPEAQETSQPQSQPEQEAMPKPQLQAPPQRPRRGSSEAQNPPSESQTISESQVQAQASSQLPDQASPECLSKESNETSKQSSEPQSLSEPDPQAQGDIQVPLQQPHTEPSDVQAEAETSKALPEVSIEVKTQSQPQPQSEPQPQLQSRAQSQAKSQASVPRQDSKEVQSTRKASGGTKQPLHRGSSEVKAQSTRRGSKETQAEGVRRGSGESQTIRRGSGEAQVRRGSGESQATVRRGSNEAQTQAGRRDSGEAQQPRKGSSESPTSPAALGQVVTRLTGLLGEQWAQLGSGSGAQQGTSQQEGPATQKQTGKQTTGKGAAAATVKGAPSKAAGKGTAAGTAGKSAGKAAPSKMSSIQSQLVSSLSVLSAFYSPGQKAAADKKQQEQGLKSIMKKNGAPDKQSRGATKKNLKFVGVNGGYETTSSEESSGDEKTREKVGEEEEDSSEPEVERTEEEEPSPDPHREEQTAGQGEVEGAAAQGGAAASGEEEVGGAPREPEAGEEPEDGAQATEDPVDQGFLDACVYVKDRMGEVSSPDKEMRQILLVLYQEWFKVSSQRDSQADRVTLYLRQVSLVTPTLLGYVINLTDGNGNTALHYSVSHSNFPVVKLLLDTGLCETDNVNKAGYTPVMLAALTAADSPDDLEVALQLLKQGKVNLRSSQAGQTALMLAVSHGRVAMVKLLLSCDADVNTQDRDGSTALMCAAEHGHAHIVRLLLDTGRCDARLTDKDGQTAMSIALVASHLDIADLLKGLASTSAAP